MSNLNPVITSLLIDVHQVPGLSSNTGHHVPSVDSFLREAREIHVSISSLLIYLRAIRTPYLSTAPPPRRSARNASSSVAEIQTSLGPIPAYISDSAREDIDSRTANLLTGIHGTLQALKGAVRSRHEQATAEIAKKYGKRSNLLFAWAAGDQGDSDAGKSDDRLRDEGKANTLSSVREGVLWYLDYKLNDTMAVRQEMVEARLEREREKRASILHDQQNARVRLAGITGNSDMRGKDTFNPALEPGVSHEELTPQQIQAFEEENSSMMNHYNDMLGQITQVEKSVMEVSQLQQTLVSHINVQSEQIEQLVTDADRTDENVQRGNKELKRASERPSMARLMYHVSIYLCTGLVVWDLIF